MSSPESFRFDQADQKLEQIITQLELQKILPEMDAPYLLHVFARMPQQPQSTRLAAAGQLLTYVRSNSAEPSFVRLLAETLVEMVGDQPEYVLRCMCMLASAICGLRMAASEWLWRRLSERAIEPSLSHASACACFSLLSRISEGEVRYWTGSIYLEVLSRRIAEVLATEDFLLHKHALDLLCTMPLTPSDCQLMLPTILKLLQSSDRSKKRDKSLCKGLHYLLELHFNSVFTRPDVIVPALTRWCSDRDDSCLQIDATATLNYLLEHTSGIAAIQPHLPSLLPILVHNMRYSDDELVRLDAQTQEEDGLDEQESDNWTLRKASASTLDCMAEEYHLELWLLLESHIQRLLNSNDWRERESGALALGAVARGCYRAMKPDLPTIMPTVVQLTNDPHSLVRGISCWAISRLVDFFLSSDDALSGLVQRFAALASHPNKKLQVQVASAFARVIETAGMKVLPLADPIAAALCTIFSRSEGRVFRVSCDCVATFCEVLKSQMPENARNLLLETLLQKWKHFPESDVSICALMECISSVVGVLRKSENAALVSDVLPRILELLPSKIRDEDDNFSASALELISVLCLEAPTSAIPLIQEISCGQMLADLVTQPWAMINVWQSAFAAAGDLIGLVPSQFSPPVLAQIVSAIFTASAHLNNAISSNAIWCLGRIAESGADLRPMLAQIVREFPQRFQQLVAAPISSANCAMALGALAKQYPTEISAVLPQVVRLWLTAVKEMPEGDAERELALTGLYALYEYSGPLIEQHLQHLRSSFGESDRFVLELEQGIEALRDQESVKKTA